MRKRIQEIDALLREAARRETEDADLNRILKKVLAEARELPPATQKARGFPRLRFAAVLTAAALVVFLAASALMKTVAVNGKAFLAIQNNVTIDGVTRRLGAPDENGLLLQIGDSNQYVDLVEAEEGTARQVFVYAPGGSPMELKNPRAVSGKGNAPESLAPVAVYPVVSDLAVREGPDTAYAALGELYSGQCVIKVGICGNWAIIAWDGALAYAFNAYLFEVPEEAPRYAPVAMRATEPVNVRALPTSRDPFSSVLYELGTGEKVVCTGSIGEWSQIEWNGQKAYVFTKYLRSEEVLP